MLSVVKTPAAAKPRKDKFPQTISKGHASVKIYRMKHRDGFTYAVTYLSATGRVKRNLSDLEEARREANTTVHQLSVGDLEAVKLTGRDRQIYVAANEAIAHTGLTLDLVAREFARAYDILGRDDVVEAARRLKEQRASMLTSMPVAAAVERFVAARIKEGISYNDKKTIRGNLINNFAAHSKCDLDSITPEDLRIYLGKRPGNATTRNNHLKTIKTLFNFAKSSGWLPSHKTTAAAGLNRYKVSDRDVEIYTPEEVAQFLNAAKKQFLPWVALLAFGGLRAYEIQKGLSWAHIDFDKGIILVPAAISKTNRKRKIEMPSNLLAWLEPYRGSTGPVFSKFPQDFIEELTAAAGVAWKRNGLRHSDGSYRMEIVKNAGQVSLEMGNSATIVLKHYYELVTADAAKAYWNIMPQVTTP